MSGQVRWQKLDVSVIQYQSDDAPARKGVLFWDDKVGEKEA